MIIDKIENLNLYKNIPAEVVGFIQKITNNPVVGKYAIDEKNYANVEEYQTKAVSEAKYEAHRNYIDIQILLKGEEQIFVKEVKNLTPKEVYNPQKDIEFYSQKVEGMSVVLDGTNFVMLFPHEAHAPQVEYERSQKVLKVVAKIKADKN